jgi:hypothetical protein
MVMNIKEQLLSYGLRMWDDHGLLLIPLDLFERVPNGAVLTSITGDIVQKGKDYIDTDTRGGLLAFGVKKEQYDDALKWFSYL